MIRGAPTSLTAPKPVANVSSGNNPRGVAIVAPKAAPKPVANVSSGNNPGGVAIIPRLPVTAKSSLKLPPTSSTKSILGMADITPHQAAIESLAKPAYSIGGKLLSQIANLPATTLEGMEQYVPALGESVLSTIEHPLHAETPQNRKLANLTLSAVHSDPIYQSITQGSLKPLGQNPLGTLLDATAVYGAAGDVAGAVARSGALGDAVKDAAALGPRDPYIAAPGVPGTAVERGFSPNLLTKGFQQVADRMSPRLPTAVKIDPTMRLQVAALHTAERGEQAADEARIVKALKSVKPRGKEEQAVAPLVVATGQNRLGLERMLNDMEREPEPLDPDTRAAREQNLGTLRAMIAKDDAGRFDWDSVNRVADAVKPLADDLEQQKALEGIRSSDEMNHALDNKRALLEPNVHYLDTPTPNPVLKQALRDARDVKRTADSDLEVAKGERAATLGSHAGASRTLAQITRQIPVAPETDTLMNNALDMRDVLDRSLAETKPYHDARVAYYEKRAENAADTLQAIRKALSDPANKLRGTMIEDDTMPPLRSGPMKGMRVRPITADDVAALRERDPATQSYVSARNPDRTAPQTIGNALRRKRGDQIVSTAEKGQKAYTGEALLAGDYRSGWSALPNSILRDTRTLAEARETHNFLDRFSIPSEEGITHFPTVADAKAAADQYKSATKIDVSTLIDDDGAIRNVPTTAVRELNRQRALDNPTGLAKAVTAPNRVFRKTVLPYSPKLPIMHNVENVSRLLAMESGNLPRIFSDYARGRSILDASDTGARLRSLVTPGSLSRSGVAGEAEDLGRLPIERSLPASVVHGIGAALGELGTQIIHGQRALEQSAQVVALGAHARTLLQEAGKSWLEANANVTKYAKDLADQLATPQEAERAARAMHTALGKYNAFTANTRLALRAMPFGSWYMNAARLVMVTLPKDHPLFDALIQDVHQATAQQWSAEHNGLPADLQTAMSAGPNEWLDIGKLTPIGLQQPYYSTAAQLVAPWATGPALALAGLDSFGDPLKGPTTAYGQEAAEGGILGGNTASAKPAVTEAIEQILESFGGPLNLAANAAYSKGGTMYNTDAPALHLLSLGKLGSVATKPGTTSQEKGILRLPGALDKVLDPFHPTEYATAGNESGLSVGGNGGLTVGNGVTVGNGISSGGTGGLTQ